MSTVKVRVAKSADNGQVPEPAEILTLAEVAAHLRVSEAAVLQAVQCQELPARQLGTEWRFSKPALQAWLTHSHAKKGIWAHVGAFKNDPDLEEILKKALQRRGRAETREG